ncbi:3-deoxy-D-manno-octulosonic acid kinase [Vibrio fluvialis]|uniref:3-deoxy-D-manno-octulosonic acid kinase n=1 Tax=Vibrio fluvialis TaxID=676 RepID=UPI0005C917D9|nr:3-deoxy-D-manno-octulosonic acid kinase [Vibrio fluvialis]MBY7975744.1 3-deoxy-D-manno-octulosonic acid kinase [Vibrio fluvialis]MBY7995852.1 3-deoxy-D-manno-octulosonic acid kinase [Vibrio fluvialis]MBY8103979.1 3-deoxy-D-manno-octulosonic acid kinase [Vibrio fluvialis]
MFKTLNHGKQTIWFDDALLTEDPLQCFDAGYWQQAGKITGSAQGRGTTWFIAMARCEAALRHYRRGGLFGKLVSDHYWFSGLERSRSYQEFQLLRKMSAAGVHVPRPIAARVSKCTVSYQADILCERIADARDLVSILQQRTLSAPMYQKIGQEIRKMHDIQINHTDLNIHNILIDRADKVWIIDFDKCCEARGDAWKESNLARLERSFNKERDKRKIAYRDEDMVQVLIGYKGQA